MTEIRYYLEFYKMTVSGHAGYAPAGQDVVCAGISTLAFSLIAATTDVPEFQTSLFIDDGKIEVQSDPLEGFEETCKATYETIYKGFKMTEESYPDHVKIIGGQNGI